MVRYVSQAASSIRAIKVVLDPTTVTNADLDAYGARSLVKIDDKDP